MARRQPDSLVQQLAHGIEILADLIGPVVQASDELQVCVLLGAEKRLRASGEGLKLINLNQHIREIFRIAGFDRVFDVE